jgi:GMP synthase (glutamine-hydrolysing)
LSDTTAAPPAPGATASDAAVPRPPAFPARARVLLLQVRDQRAAELHEQQCFLDRLGLAPERLSSLNVVEQAMPSADAVAAADLVVLGGAGAHSAYLDYPFTEPLAELVREVIERGRPFFGACFGHQFMGRALGGSVAHDPANEEIGTFDVELTPAGIVDPLFRGVPSRFAVHLGHHDRIDRMPANLVTLASSPRCTQQVVRVAGKPAYGAQFHCEMTEQHMRERVLMYASDYMSGDDPLAELARRLKPTPWADVLLARFAAEFV